MIHRLAAVGRRAGPAILAIGVLLGPAGPVRAAEPTFGTPTVSAAFGVAIHFGQPVTLDVRPVRVDLELVIGIGAESTTLVVDPGLDVTAGASTLRYDFATPIGGLDPNSPVVGRFRVTTASGTALGPPMSVLYADTRLAWKTLAGSVVRVHWTDGSSAFARRALGIGEDAVASVADLLGVTERDPIDFFIYADRQQFYDVLGPATRENVGGVALVQIRTLFANIAASAVDAPWVGIVVPHELTHLVFDTAVRNPYHDPPRWFDEGIAVYLSQGYEASFRGLVENAVGDGSLMPLGALVSQFPTEHDPFYLAYAESVSAVDFLVRTYGRSALVALVRTYHDGVTDDAAFQRAIGVDVAGFEAAWLGALGATAPRAYGPQPAATGPVPSDWLGAAPTYGAVEPGATDAGTRSPAPGASSHPATPDESGDATGVDPAIVGGLVGAIAVIAVLVALAGRRRRGPTGPPDTPDGGAS